MDDWDEKGTVKRFTFKLFKRGADWDVMAVDADMAWKAWREVHFYGDIAQVTSVLLVSVVPV